MAKMLGEHPRRMTVILHPVDAVRLDRFLERHRKTASGFSRELIVEALNRWERSERLEPAELKGNRTHA